MSLRKEVLTELEQTSFPVCKSRKNVSDNPNSSFVLGTVNYRGQKFVQYKTKGPSRWNKKFPTLHSLLKKLIKQTKPNFEYTTIQVNKNVTCKPHIDINNVGKSYIIALGDFTGGELVVEGTEYSIKNKFKCFNGTNVHWTNPFKGTRYAIVYFTHTFKPPNRSLTNLLITKHKLSKDGVILKTY